MMLIELGIIQMIGVNATIYLKVHLEGYDVKIMH